MVQNMFIRISYNLLDMGFFLFLGAEILIYDKIKLSRNIKISIVSTSMAYSKHSDTQIWWSKYSLNNFFA
jgi:hypothetical protein